MTTKVAAIWDRSSPCSPLSVPNSQTALLLLDYQNLMLGYVSDPITKSTIINTATSLRSWALQSGITVYHCLVDARPDASPVPTAKFMQRWETQLKPRIVENPELADEIAELKCPNSEREKISSRQAGLLSALSEPGLLSDLKVRGVRSLIMCGISTSAVVFSTARHANEFEYLVTVVEDGCWDPIEGLGELLVKRALPTTAHIACSREVMEVWGRK